MTSTPTLVRPMYSPDDLAIMWAVPRSAVRDWINNGDLSRSPQQFAVTSLEVLRFVDSAEGRALINAARL